MAIFRKIHISFWSDTFIMDLDAEQKLFYIYLLTNERTKQCGIYEISKKQMSFDLGYSMDKVSELLQYFIQSNKIAYSESTREIALKHWLKYNDSTSPKVLACVNKELKQVKDTLLIDYIKGIDTLSQEEQEPEQKEEQKEEQQKEEQQEEKQKEEQQEEKQEEPEQQKRNLKNNKKEINKMLIELMNSLEYFNSSKGRLGILVQFLRDSKIENIEREYPKQLTERQIFLINELIGNDSFKLTDDEIDNKVDKLIPLLNVKEQV